MRYRRRQVTLVTHLPQEARSLIRYKSGKQAWVPNAKLTLAEGGWPFKATLVTRRVRIGA